MSHNPLTINVSDDQAYDWVPERFRYLINDPDARLKVRKDFYHRFGTDASIRSTFWQRIIRWFTGREGLGISELKFLKWEIRRTVLNPVDEKGIGGSHWWRNVNLRFIITAQIAAEMVDGKRERDHVFTNEINLWLEFIKQGTARSWYRAHNASIVRAYLDFAEYATRESVYEQTFMNEVLYRVLFAQAMEEDYTEFKGVGEFAANPLLPAVDLMVHLPAFYPVHYPLSREDIQHILHKGHCLEGDFVRDFDDYLIYPHIPVLYKAAAEWINIPELFHLQQDGRPVYPNPNQVLTHLP